MDRKRIRAAEAAERLGLASETLRKMRQKRVGPAFEKIGRLVYYRVTDLDAWQDGQVTERVEPRRLRAVS